MVPGFEDRALKVLEIAASPMRPDGTWNYDREALRRIANDLLRYYNTPGLHDPVDEDDDALQEP